MVLVQRARARDAALVLSYIVLQGNLLEHSLEDGQQLHCSFLEERKAEIRNETDLFKRLLLNQLFCEIAAKTLRVMNKKMGDHDSLVSM